MKIKSIIPVLLIAFMLSSCTPAITIPAFTETAAPIPTSTPGPTTDVIAPTLTAEAPAPGGTPTGSLSAQGPWLLYVHNSPRPPMPGSDSVPAEFTLLNQDGSGATPITVPRCGDGMVNSFLIDGPNSANYLARYAGGLYLFRPLQATGMLVYERLFLYSTCQTFFSGDETGGLLASMYQPANDDVPELMIFELPSGKIRDRFPLVRCGENAKVCEKYRSNWDQMMGQEPQWSPNGRYLAFAAILDADSSDLYVYDGQDRTLRRLTSGPDWVGPIEWSPDGTQIIMQELLNDDEFFFAPSSKPPTSVWSVSVSTNEIKLLYTTEGAYARQNILRWLDDQRFIAYEGFLVNADQARNLRLVDMKTGTNRILFYGEFGSESFDPIHETVAVYALYGEQYPQGIHLVSAKDYTVRYLEGPPYVMDFPEWDPETGLFISEDACENDPQGVLAVNYLGSFTCVPQPVPTPAFTETTRYPDPNGTSFITLKDGIWLETQGNAAVQISPQTASDVIWCPDSSCFFFFMPQPDHTWTLHHVSMPDLTLKIVDEDIESIGGAQWLGVELGQHNATLTLVNSPGDEGKLSFHASGVVGFRSHDAPGDHQLRIKGNYLYDHRNARPTWLELAHKHLDQAVFAAYGWRSDLSDEEILEKLLALNLERAGH